VDRQRLLENIAGRLDRSMLAARSDRVTCDIDIDGVGQMRQRFVAPK